MNTFYHCPKSAQMQLLVLYCIATIAKLAIFFFLFLLKLQECRYHYQDNTGGILR